MRYIKQQYTIFRREKFNNKASSYCLKLLGNLFILIIIISIFISNNLISPIENVSAEVEREVLGTGPGRFNSIVAEDIDDDGRCEIVFGNYEGQVTVLEYRDYDFHQEWQSSKIGHRMWGITVGDFLGDSTKEIIAGNGNGELIVFDGKSHKKVWYAEDLVRDVHGLYLHNLGSKDTTYLLAGTGYKTDKDLGTVYIFIGNSTKPIAKIGQFENRLRGIGVGDVDKDGELEIVVGSGNATGESPGNGYVRVFNVADALDPSTLDSNDPIKPEWKSTNLKGDCVAVELADFTGDGYPDIVVGNGYRYDAGWVRVITYDSGKNKYVEYWKSPDIGPKPYGLCVADLDENGKLDIVVGNQPGYIYIFEQTGTGSLRQVWKSNILGTDILGIDIEDVDKDGQLEIVAAQGGYIGKGDYTSGYSDPHIYIIDGKTHEIEIIIGETHWLGFALQVTILILIILFLVGLNYYLKYRKRVKLFIESKKEGKLVKSISTPSPKPHQNPIFSTNSKVQAIAKPIPRPSLPKPTQPALPTPPLQPEQPVQPVQAIQSKQPPQVFDPFKKEEED